MYNYIQEHWLTSNSISGLLHFSTATIGLFLGLGILLLHPGSKTHKIAGYIFIPIVLIMNFSAFFIHEMGMTFGPFHYLIPVSLFGLFFGVYPFWFKKFPDPKQGLKIHIRAMIGTALGLWAAFFAELVARLPQLQKTLMSISDNPFIAVTVEGFAFVLLFNYIIRKVTKRQFTRLGLN